jgi:hypothetical protein
MSVASDHLADIGFAHFDFENQLASLLYLCHHNLFRCFNKLSDDKLEKSLHEGYSVGAAAAFLRALRIMLATVELGRAPCVIQ